MNLVLHLTAELESKLREQAARTGKEPEVLALDALREQLAAETGAAAVAPPAEWLERFDAWVSGQRSRNPRVDDSRDSTYPDRR